MIKPEELRIGNWIMDRGSKMWQIHSWECYNKVADAPPLLHYDTSGKMYGHPLTEYVEYLQPIPLSPAILDKCGFEKLNFGWNKGDFGLFDFNYGTGELNLRLNACECPLPYIKYLHTLQNVYYSLTGTELIFQP